MKLRIKKKKQKQLDLINAWILYRFLTCCPIRETYLNKEKGIYSEEYDKRGWLNEIYVFPNQSGFRYKFNDSTVSGFSNYNTIEYFLNNIKFSNKDMVFIKKHMKLPNFWFTTDMKHHGDARPYLRIYRGFDEEGWEDQKAWDEFYEKHKEDGVL